MGSKVSPLPMQQSVLITFVQGLSWFVCAYGRYSPWLSVLILLCWQAEFFLSVRVIV